MLKVCICFTRRAEKCSVTSGHLSPPPRTAQIGRVLTVHHGTGLGGKLLKKGIEVVRETMQPERILLEAQSYATGYYAREGFQVTSDEFLEDGIPHVWMTLDCR